MLQLAKVTEESYVDGPGKRFVVHFQGCSIHCPGCQNRHLQDPCGGETVCGLGIAKRAVDSGLPITVTGGEPFDQPGELAALVMTIRALAPNRHIIVYTGYTFEQLIASHQTAVLSALSEIDILVDGPYRIELDSPNMQYRGSSNQRVIDLRATWEQLSAREILSCGPVDIAASWDVPEFIITEDGDILGAEGIFDAFSLDETLPTRRCGEA